MPNPTWFEWITFLAILAGPVLAILTQRFIDSARERSERRNRLFLTLMATRRTPLAPDHINALNTIDVIFNRKRKDDSVRTAWAKVIAHAEAGAGKTPDATWQERYSDLKADLLREIGMRVGYTFDTDYLKRQVYHPQAFVDLELDQLKLRRSLSQALTEDGLKIIPGNVPTAAPKDIKQA